MKVTLRALAQKVTLVSAAFVLAVSTLTASMPFILSSDVAATQGPSTASTAEITAFEPFYRADPLVPGGVMFNLKTSGVADATELRLVIKSLDGTSATLINSGTGTALNAINVNGNVSGTYIIQQGPYTSGSWTQLGPWLTTQAPTTADIYVTRAGGEVLQTTAPIASNQGASATQAMAGYVAPSITALEPFYRADSLVPGGVMFNIKTTNITTAKEVKVVLKATDGTEAFVKNSTTGTALNAINVNGNVSGTYIIQQGPYTSGSWVQSGPWLTTEAPITATAIITLVSGEEITATAPIASNQGANATQAMAGYVVPDVTPPVFEVTNLTNGQVVSTATTNKLTIRGTLTDPSGAYVLLQLVKPGVGAIENILVHAPVTNSILGEFNTTGLEDGAYQLHVNSLTDYKGNAGPSSVISFTLDNTAPTISWQVQPKAIYGAGEGFHVRPITGEVGTLKQLYVDSVDTQNLVRELDNDAKNFDVKDTANAALWGSLANGTYKFIAVFTDRAGNITTSTSNSFVIDREGPVAEVTNATALGDTVTIEGAVSDTTNLRHYYCYLTTNQTITVDGHTFTPGQEVYLNDDPINGSSRNGACNTTLANGQNSFTGALGGFNIPNVPDGDYTVNLVAYDLAGNNNAANPATYTFTLDRTAPIVTIDPTTATTNTPTLTGTVDDNTATVTVTVDGVDYAETVTVTGTTWSVTLPAHADGRYAVEVTALDTAGNTSVPATATLSIVTVVADPDTTDEDEADTTTATIVLPPATNPAGQPAVQGDSTQNTGTPGVEGTATENVAQAVDSEANQGTLWGLAWYWWLLILAGVATVFWWVIAALRRRQGEA